MAIPQLSHNLLNNLVMISKIGNLRCFYSQTNLELLLNKFASTRTPYFKVQSNSIEIIRDPMDFYLNIHKLARASYKRIGLSSLYLGTGTLERYFLQHVLKNIEDRPDLNIRLLFDYYRSKRIEKGQSGIDMVKHAIEFLPNRVKAGYLTQNNSPLLKMFSKGLSEVIGVHHMKLYVFDDTTIITGANLSHSYFTRRQDRCIMIKDCQPLSSYFYDLINSLVDGSHLQIEPAKQTFGSKENLGQYYKLWRFGNKRVPKQQQTSEQQQMEFDPSDLEKQKKTTQKKQIHDLQLRSEFVEIKENIRRKLQSSFEQKHIEKSLNQLSLLKQQTKEIEPLGEAVYIFPTIQINSIGENLEKQTITQVLKHNVKSDNRICISSGYMNFPNFIIDILLQTKSNIPIVTSSPKANSFFQGGRFKKYIPYFYRAFQHFLLKRAKQQKAPLEILEYENDDWTFHTKGIWIQQIGSGNMVSIVGSSNFNMRSYERDTECQVYLYSTCGEFNSRLKEEWQLIVQKTKKVDCDIDKDKKLKVGKTIKGMARLLGRFL